MDHAERPHWAWVALLPVAAAIVASLVFAWASWASSLVHTDQLHYVDQTQYNKDSVKLNKIDLRTRAIQIQLAELIGELKGAQALKGNP